MRKKFKKNLEFKITNKTYDNTTTKIKTYRIKPKNKSSPMHNKKFRTFKLRVIYLFISAVIITTIFTLSMMLIFKIKYITVNGNISYSSSEIINKSAIFQGENLILCNSYRAIQLIEQELPFIGSVEIKKKIPSTLEINVTETLPLAVIKLQNGTFALIDKNCKVLDLTDQITADLSLIKGVTIDSVKTGSSVNIENEVKQILHDVLTAIEDNELQGNISEVDISDKYHLQMRYNQQFTIILGKPLDIDYKVKFAKNVLQDPYVMATNRGQVDVSICKNNNRAYFNPIS